MIVKVASPKFSSPTPSSSVGSSTPTSGSGGMGMMTKVVIVLAIGVTLYFGYTKIIKPMMDKRNASKKEEENAD